MLRRDVIVIECESGNDGNEEVGGKDRDRDRDKDRGVKGTLRRRSPTETSQGKCVVDLCGV